jgi:hypothetical protein
LAARIVPFVFVEYPEQRTFSEKMFDIFYQAGLADDDPYASIVRVNVVQDIDRDEMRQTLRRRLAPRDAEGLIWFLDDHDWDAAFLIDGTE